MSEKNKRFWGYGLTSLIVVTLCYLGFIRPVNADPDTLIGAAEVQIRMASTLPQSARGELLQTAGEFLDRVDEISPNSTDVGELRGMLHYLEGDYRKAAQVYAQASTWQDNSSERMEMAVLNRSRMLRAAGDAEAAWSVLQAYGSFDEQRKFDSQIERVEVLVAMARGSEAFSLCQEMLPLAESPMARMQVARLLECQEKWQQADIIYAQAAAEEPEANYRRAMLKMRLGELDTGLDLLRLAVSAQESETRALLRQDREFWAAWAQTEGFSDLLYPRQQTAQPGR